MEEYAREPWWADSLKQLILLYIWTIYIFVGITVKILFIIYAVLVIVRPFDARMIVI